MWFRNGNAAIERWVHRSWVTVCRVIQFLDMRYVIVRDFAIFSNEVTCLLQDRFRPIFCQIKWLVCDMWSYLQSLNINDSFSRAHTSLLRRELSLLLFWPHFLSWRRLFFLYLFLFWRWRWRRHFFLYQLTLWFGWNDEFPWWSLRSRFHNLNDFNLRLLLFYVISFRNLVVEVLPSLWYHMLEQKLRRLVLILDFFLDYVDNVIRIGLFQKLLRPLVVRTDQLGWIYLVPRLTASFETDVPVICNQSVNPIPGEIATQITINHR